MLAPLSSALSISPGRIAMDFVPGYEDEFEGHIASDVTKQIDVSVEGELSDYMELLTPEEITVYANSPSAYRFRIKLPEKFDVPGTHVGYVFASEHVDAVSGMAIARVKVGTTIWVHVPYPGKYAEMKMDIENPKVRENVLFKVTVTNRGKENISMANCEVEIVDLENKTVARLQAEGRPIEITKTEIFQVSWFSDASPGLYKAKARVFYDGETAATEREFNLGAPLIKITNVSAKAIENGTIGKIFTQIRSFWNEEIADVYAELRIRDEKGDVIASDKSQNVVASPFAVMTVTNYWDTTEGAEPGDYKAQVILHYLDKNDTAEVDIEVVSKPGFTLGVEMMLIIAAVIIAAVIVAIALLRRKKNGSKFEQKRLM